jgi:hypothetical protein
MGLFDSSSSQLSAPTNNTINVPFSPNQAGSTRPIGLNIVGPTMGSGNKFNTKQQKNNSVNQRSVLSAGSQSATANYPTGGSGTGVAVPSIGSASSFFGGSLETSGTLNTVTAIDASSHDTTYSNYYSQSSATGYGSGSTSNEGGGGAASSGQASEGINWTTIIEIAAVAFVLFFALRKG